MHIPRLRVFAGPNGSGKSTLFEAFAVQYDAGVFLNSDVIEKELSTKGFIDLHDFKLTLSQSDLDIFLQSSRAKSLVQKAIASKYEISFSLKENIVFCKTKQTHSYEGALINAFLRHHLIAKSIDFSFETVMSHPSKIEEIIEAKHSGFKTYLYFICTDDPEVNISRVENRVEKGGHAGASDKIVSRYLGTLELLSTAIEQVDKCYIFDNSGASIQLIARIVDSQLFLEVDANGLPNWFVANVLTHFS